MKRIAISATLGAIVGILAYDLGYLEYRMQQRHAERMAHYKAIQDAPETYTSTDCIHSEPNDMGVREQYAVIITSSKGHDWIDHLQPNFVYPGPLSMSKECIHNPRSWEWKKHEPKETK